MTASWPGWMSMLPAEDCQPIELVVSTTLLSSRLRKSLVAMGLREAKAGRCHEEWIAIQYLQGDPIEESAKAVEDLSFMW